MLKSRNVYKIATTAIIIILAVICLIGAGCFIQPAYADIASGTSGTCSWVIDDAGVLTISPTDGVSGTMASYTGISESSGPWYSYRTQITKVLVEPGASTGAGCNYLFCGFLNCTEMDLANLDTSNATSMQCMFNGCSKLTSLDVSGFDTGNVTIMSAMFASCSGLTSLDVSGFDTGKVTNMSSTFYNCSGLTNLDVSGFDTSNVTNMNSMFYNCSKLTSLDLSGFDTGNVTNMRGMFNGCSALTSLDMSGFDTSKVTRMDDMFSGCSNLSEVTLGENFSFKGKNISNTSYMAALPTPPASLNGTTYTQKWIKEDETAGPLTAAALRDQYTDNAATWAGKWIWARQADVKYTLKFICDDTYPYTGSMAQQLVTSTSSYTLPYNEFSVWKGTFDHWEVVGSSPLKTYTNRAYISANTYSAGQVITLKAVFNMDMDPVQYTVKHFQQNTSLNDYDMYEFEQFTVTPYSDVTPEVKTYEGFNSPSTQTAQIATDNTIIEYYYDRKFYYVAFDGNGYQNETYRNAATKYEWYDPATGTYPEIADYNAIPETYLPARKVPAAVRTKLVINNYFNGDNILESWNTERDGSGETYGNGQTILDIANEGETIILYAQWAENQNTITSNTTGELVVTCKAGERVVIPGLPAGTAYTVEEINNPNGWTETGTVQDISDQPTKMEPNGVYQAEVTNRYQTAGYATIEAHKKLEGATLSSNMYTFQLLDSNGNVVDTQANGSLDNDTVIHDESGDIDNPWCGSAPVQFTDLSFTEAGTYTYIIREVIGSDDRVEYDEHTETVTVTATDNGDGTLETTVSYDADGALFTNKIKSAGIINLTKHAENATVQSSSQQFQFQINLTDADENPLQGEYDANLLKGYKTNGEEATITATATTIDPAVASSQKISNGSVITIPADQTLEITGLPYDAKYTITELPVDGWELISSSNANGQITGDEAYADFTNTYSTSGSAQIEASKKLVGGNIAPEQFVFELRNMAGDLIDTAYANEDGTIVFKPIDYTYDDDGRTYYYYVRELPGEEEIVYDTSDREVSVQVADDGHGHMETTVTYDPNGMEFVNRVLTHLTISKQVKGNMANRDKLFSYTLALFDSDGEPYAEEIAAPDGAHEWAKTGDGAYCFQLRHGDSITMTLPSGVIYTVTENPDEYFCRLTLTEGDKKIKNEEDAPTAQGTLNALNGDTVVAYTNYLVTVIPTGVDDYATIGAWIAIIGIITTGVILIRRSKKRKASAV